MEVVLGSRRARMRVRSTSSTGTGRFVVGRSSQAAFSMPEDRLLSREHFRDRGRAPGLHLLNDLGSTNGTKVNGLRVETAPLRDGDMITAGESAFVDPPRSRRCRASRPRPVVSAAATRSDGDELESTPAADAGTLFLASAKSAGGFPRPTPTT